MIFVINKIHSPKLKKLIELAKSKGFIIVETVSGTENLLKKYKNQTGIVIGADYFCSNVIDKMGWAFYQNSEDWVASLDNCFTKREIKLMKLSDIRKFFQIYEEQKQHLKKKNKIITSLKNSIHYFNFECDSLDTLEKQTTYTDDDQILIVSDKIEFSSKFICFIINGKLSAYSALLNNSSNQSHDPTDFITNLISANKISPGCILKVGIVNGRGWAVEEEVTPHDTESFLETHPNNILEILKVSFAYPMAVAACNAYSNIEN